LSGLAPAPRGIPKVDVTFDIDANGILNVTAKDQASGKSQSISITGSTRLSEDEKKRMVSDAEKYAEADKQRREQAEKLNAADAMCYQAEKMLADFGDKLTDEIKQRINNALRDTREAMEKHDPEQATQRAEALGKILKEAGVSVYAQTPGAEKVYRETRAPGMNESASEPRPTGSGPQGRVVDAEFKETGSS